MKRRILGISENYLHLVLSSRIIFVISHVWFLVYLYVVKALLDESVSSQDTTPPLWYFYLVVIEAFNLQLGKKATAWREKHTPH